MANTRKPSRPLSQLPITHQLKRLESLLLQCGDREKQKTLVNTLYSLYQSPE